MRYRFFKWLSPQVQMYMHCSNSLKSFPFCKYLKAQLCPDYIHLIKAHDVKQEKSNTRPTGFIKNLSAYINKWKVISTYLPKLLFFYLSFFVLLIVCNLAYVNKVMRTHVGLFTLYLALNVDIKGEYRTNHLHDNFSFDIWSFPDLANCEAMSCMKPFLKKRNFNDIQYTNKLLNEFFFTSS